MNKTTFERRLQQLKLLVDNHPHKKRTYRSYDRADQRRPLNYNQMLTDKQIEDQQEFERRQNTRRQG